MRKILISFFSTLFALFVLAVPLVTIVSCSNDAEVASRNLSQAADNFEIKRRIVFYNGITDKYILVIEGFCSLGQGQMDKELTVICKTGPSEYKKHFLGKSDNLTYFSEQLDSANVSAYYYQVTFKPESIVPDVKLR